MLTSACAKCSVGPAASFSLGSTAYRFEEEWVVGGEQRCATAAAATHGATAWWRRKLSSALWLISSGGWQ